MSRKPAKNKVTKKTSSFKLQGRDQRIVWFVAVHGYVTMPHIKLFAFEGRNGWDRWESVSEQAVYRRLKVLCDADLLAHQRTWYGDHGVYRATRAGLKMVDLDVAPARVDKRDYEHDLRVVDLALRLTDYTGNGWIPERMIRSRLRPGASIGRVPDGLLLGPGGERWAVELEVSGKESQRYHEACRKYAGRHRITIPDGYSEMEEMEEYVDDYFRSGGEVDGVVWYFFSEKKRRRALAEAEKVLASLGRQRRRTDHLRFLFYGADQPVPPPFEKWERQQQGEREAEKRRRRERGEQQWRGSEDRSGPEGRICREPGDRGPLSGQEGEINIMDAAVVVDAVMEAGEKQRRAQEEKARAKRGQGKRERRRGAGVRGWWGGR